MTNIKFRNYNFIFFPILLLSFSACAGLTKHLEPPTVQIASVEVKELKGFEATFNVQLRVLNPNDISFITKGINFDVDINNNHLATGVSNAAVEIPAFGNAIIPIDVFSSALDVVKTVFTLSDKEISRYKIRGRLRLEGGSFMLSSIPFESEGDLDIKGLMEKQ